MAVQQSPPRVACMNPSPALVPLIHADQYCLARVPTAGAGLHVYRNAGSRFANEKCAPVCVLAHVFSFPGACAARPGAPRWRCGRTVVCWSFERRRARDGVETRPALSSSLIEISIREISSLDIPLAKGLIAIRHAQQTHSLYPFVRSKRIPCTPSCAANAFPVPLAIYVPWSGFGVSSFHAKRMI